METLSPIYEDHPVFHARLAANAAIPVRLISAAALRIQPIAVNLKYLIVSQGDLEVPLVFSPLLLHEQVAEKCRIISAGFCGWDNTGKWIAGGRSASLALSARPQDAGILNTHLGAGGSPNPAAGHAAPARFCFDGQSGAKPESHFVKTQNPPTVRPQ